MLAGLSTAWLSCMEGPECKRLSQYWPVGSVWFSASLRLPSICMHRKILMCSMLARTWASFEKGCIAPGSLIVCPQSDKSWHLLIGMQQTVSWDIARTTTDMNVLANVASDSNELFKKCLPCNVFCAELPVQAAMSDPVTALTHSCNAQLNKASCVKLCII